MALRGIVHFSSPDVADTRPFLAPNPSVPFNNNDWPVSARTKLSFYQEYALNLLPILSVLPFGLGDWPIASRRVFHQRDNQPNVFLVLNPPPIIILPFSSADWPIAARRIFYQRDNQHNVFLILTKICD